MLLLIYNSCVYFRQILKFFDSYFQVHQCLVGIFHNARMMEVLRKCSVIPPQDIVGVLILKAGRLKEQRSEEFQAARKVLNMFC